jgi:hypothetical protein
MTDEFDDLFTEVRDAQNAADPDAERKLAWEQWLDELIVAIQPVADAAVSHGHQAVVTRQDRTVEFVIHFSSHPGWPASCSFSPIFPSGGETAVYVDSNGPGKLDDPRDPMRKPLTRFSMDDARDYVTSVIRSASKLLP